MKKLYLSLLFSIPVSLNAQTFYVDISNETGTEDGTATHPFSTIEKGLLSCNNPDTLFIATGEYFPDSLKVTRNITIGGEGKENDARADAFEFELAADSLFNEIIVLNEWVTDTVVSVSELLTVNYYFWRVRSLRLGYMSDWSETRSFSTTPSVGISTIKKEKTGVVSCYPNPFSDKTSIVYYLAEPGHISLQIFDLTGRKVTILEDGFKPAGLHRYEFDASGLSGKFFICRLLAGNNIFPAKLIRIENQLK